MHWKLWIVKRDDCNQEARRGRPRKYPPKVTIPPLYIFVRNLLYNTGYNPSVVAWVNIEEGSFRITRWGLFWSNTRSIPMTILFWPLLQPFLSCWYLLQILVSDYQERYISGHKYKQMQNHFICLTSKKLQIMTKQNSSWWIWSEYWWS